MAGHCQTIRDSYIRGLHLLHEARCTGLIDYIFVGNAESLKINIFYPADCVALTYSTPPIFDRRNVEYRTRYLAHQFFSTGRLQYSVDEF